MSISLFTFTNHKSKPLQKHKNQNPQNQSFPTDKSVSTPNLIFTRNPYQQGKHEENAFGTVVALNRFEHLEQTDNSSFSQNRTTEPFGFFESSTRDVDSNNDFSRRDL